MQFVVEVAESDALRRVAKLAAAMGARDRLTTNRKAAIALHSYVMQVFEAEGAHDGRPRWAPLKAGGRWLYTQHRDGSRSRKRFQTDHQILQDTGALRQSYLPLYTSDVAGVGAVSRAKHAELAKVHQFGNPAKGLPARPMLPDTQTAIGIVADVYGLAIRQAAAR